MRFGVQAIFAVAVAVLPVHAAGQDAPQTQADDYTRYELLAPGTGQFRILYEVTATKAGAPFFFNAIRKGSVASDEHVFDAATGAPLKFEVVSGATARAQGHPTADLDTEWIKVYLARPVPADGEARVVIDKTYKDDKSYFVQGETIVFDRPLGIRRNSVVLPAGYRLIACNVPSQVLSTPDGRVMIAFMHPGPAAAPLVIEALPGLAPFTPPAGRDRPDTFTNTSRLVERAHHDREIVYRLGDPATHTVEVTHDYTEARVGVSHYLNVVAEGLSVSAPTVRNLDTGESLPVQVTSPRSLGTWKITPEEPVPPRSRVVLASFPAVTAGHSIRLRVTAATTDPAYRLHGDELHWQRVFDRPRSAVVLPPGWTVVTSSMPCTVDVTPEGHQRLSFENDRPDDMLVLIRARRIR